MRQFLFKLLLLTVCTAALVGCGVPGIPKPPSLDLPEPVTDLHAVRKGESVYLDWTVPAETTDRLAVRHPGATRICRSLDAAMIECANPVGEVSAPRVSGASPRQTKVAKPTAKLQANYRDDLSKALLVENPHAQIFYAISVLNENGRSAGISNLVRVPGVATLPPPSDFRAQVTAEGVVLSWTAIPSVSETPGLQHMYRVYRRPEGERADTVAGEVPLDALSAPQIVDHSFEWE